MSDLQVTQTGLDFSKVHETLQSYVDREIIPFATSAVLKGQDIVDLFATGRSDIEAGKAARTDDVVRLHSTTKLFVSTAIMMFIEEGKMDLDDPVDKWIPQLANRKVLVEGATDGSQTEDANGPITIRHLLSHSAGLTYGLFDPGTVGFTLYNENNVNDFSLPLSAMMDALESIPLVYQPGTSWEYSVATDVLGHLVEVVSDMTLGTFFDERIFKPLDMVDTGFYLKAHQIDRFTPIYLGADMADPMKPGLTVSPGLFAADYSKEPIRHSGGGGMIGTIEDCIRWIRSFIPGGNALLKPETIKLMMQNTLAPGSTVRFAGVGEVPQAGFGLGGCVKLGVNPGEHENVAGEFHWGGVGGTHWWINPGLGIAGLCFTQREMAFWHPFSAAFKNEAYAALA